MVKLNKIYTRSGDDGRTRLASGKQVSKADARVEAYGAVDEANAAVGVAICAADRVAELRPISDLLRSIQHDMFDLGADLATPRKPGETPGASLRVVPSQVERLEREIDRVNARLEPLNSFVLPGGSDAAAALHVARTVVRRAERAAVALQQAPGEDVNPDTVRFLNRLSDLLFVLARLANDSGESDVLWVPGVNRGPAGNSGSGEHADPKD